MKTNYLLLLSIKLLLLIPVNVFSQDINFVKIGVGNPLPADYYAVDSENTFNITVPFGEALYFEMGCSNYHPWELTLENAPSEIGIENLDYSSGPTYYYAHFHIIPSTPGSFTFDLVSTNTSSGNEVGRQTINLTVTPLPSANNILYVNKNVTGGNQSGDSWANALPELADALKWANLNQDPNWATTPLKIFVAKGTYHPLYSPEDGANFGTDQGRDNAFLMVNNVQLYGGFDPANGIDDLTDARLLPSTSTGGAGGGSTLNGDLNDDDVVTGSGSSLSITGNTENAYHVVLGAGPVGSAQLDGFTISGGNADGSSLITANSENFYRTDGGGMSNSTSSPLLVNVSITGNTSSNFGGGMFNANSSFPKLINVGITRNSSSNGGGMLNINAGSPELINVSIAGNSATNGSGIYNYFSTASPQLQNTIVWDGIYNKGGSYSAEYSLILGSSNTSNGNIDATGLTATDIFTDPTNGDYSLKNTSPTINAGSNSDYEAADGDTTNNSLQNDMDLAGNARLVGSTIDMGTYEAQNTPPVVICQDISISLDANGQVTITAADIDNGSSDAEGSVTLSIDINTFDCNDLGANTVTLSVTDAANVTVTCTATVTVVDDLAPVPDMASLPDIVKECAVSNVDIPIPTATDNCTGTIQAVTIDPLNYNTQGTYTIWWNYTDVNGNIVLQTQNIIVDDITNPVPDIGTLPDIVMECAVTSADIPIPTATDNCIGNIQASTNDPLSYSTQGTHTITWNYDDGNGNMISQTQTIIVDDITNPVPDIATLPDIVMECAVATADIPVPTATDNCGGTITGTTSDPLNYSTQGSYTITWNYDDGNGNTVSQTQTVIVDDTTAPVPDVATLPDIVMECAVTSTDIPIPTATDNCAGIIQATTNDPLNYSIQGNYTITWNYDDGNGNTVSQMQTVIVDDVTAPVPDMATLPDITMECAVAAADIPIPTATDNCGGNILATTTDPMNYNTQGTYIITWNYDDGNGNSISQTQTVIVDDTTAPVPDVATLPDIVMECAVVSADIPIPTATDNCAGSITATTSDPLSYSTQGSYTITWNYDDGNGNTVSQTQSIVVQPSPLEAVTFSDVTVTYDGTLHTVQVGNLPSGASASYSTNPTTGTPNGAVDAGTYMVTAIVTPPSSAVNCDPITLTATLTIQQAAQQIIFDPLPVKSLEDDPDFQLQATASSGLPVSYTYTFTATNPPATVSPTGWVTLLTSGVIQITANQAGNANYLPAAPVTQPLQINSRDASIHLLTIENEHYPNPGPEVYYLIACGTSKNEVDVSMETETNATVVPAHNFTIETPKPGIYTQEVVVTSQDGSTTRTYVIRVEKRFNFEAITEQKFDNVLLVNNNPQTNGGYKFVAYEWYRNNTLVGREQYYSAGESIQDLLDANASWYVKMTTVDGKILQTCMGSVTLEHTYAISLWPNPVPEGIRVVDLFVDYPTGELSNMQVSIYSLTGEVVKQVQIDQRKSRIQLPSGIASDVYLILCETPQFSKTFKIIVE